MRRPRDSRRSVRTQVGLTCYNEQTFVVWRSMSVPDHELIALSRSAAMAQPNSKVAVEREALMSMVDELTDHRRLLRRLGGDLKTVARNAPPVR